VLLANLSNELILQMKRQMLLFRYRQGFLYIRGGREGGVHFGYGYLKFVPR